MPARDATPPPARRSRLLPATPPLSKLRKLSRRKSTDPDVNGPEKQEGYLFGDDLPAFLPALTAVFRFATITPENRIVRIKEKEKEMSREEVFERLTEVFRAVFDDDSIELKETTTAKDIEDWDSFEHINLIVAVENEFSIKVPMGKVTTMKDVGEMVDIILEESGAN